MTELEKWENCHKEAVLIKEFLDFAKYEENAELMTLEDSGEGFKPVYKLVAEDKLINAFFNIDEKKLKEERRAMLEKQKDREEGAKAFEGRLAIYKVDLSQDLSKLIGEVLEDFFGAKDGKPKQTAE